MAGSGDQWPVYDIIRTPLMSWIAFDEVTHDALNRLREADDQVGFSADDPLDYALRTEKSSVVLLPSGDEVVLLTIKHNVINNNIWPEEIPSQPEPSEPKVEAGIHYVGGGFLGLSDEVALDEEPEEHKSWWKRLFE